MSASNEGAEDGKFGTNKVTIQDSTAPWKSGELGPKGYSNETGREVELRLANQDSEGDSRLGSHGVTGGATQYRTYKRRWFGLVQLTLMNIMVSWDWLTYAPVASKAAHYYSVSETAINWISTAFFLAFVAIFPLAIAILHRGPKLSMMYSAGFLLVGNWIRFGGSSKASGGNFACAMAGTIICGFAQPFVLAAPTRFSDMWFTNRGRVAATAVASLANPLGAALAQLINPFWVNKDGDVSHMTLWVSIMTTVACIPVFFIPSHPPTPVGPSSETPKVSIRQSIKIMSGSPEIALIIIPYAIYVGFFNSISSLLNQIMRPYGFSDDDAGIGGAILIVVGLVCAAIISPICDRTKKYIFFIKLFVPIIAASFLAFTWMPETRSLPGPYIVLAIMGGSCFALVPIALEFLSELSHPISPEVTSTIAWAGGQLFGAIFVIISDALSDGSDGHPPNNMKRALIFQAVVAMAVAPLPLALGLFGRKDKVALRRIRSDEQGHG